ncbi:MAG: hypothetical protein MUF54_12170 [Polyangiaceae bacterium]|jgi:hypothetical protein|nr:hypothetical protein [Polyangiaceae bacterium]
MLIRRFATTGMLRLVILGCGVALSAPLWCPDGVREARAAVSLEVTLPSLAKRATSIVVGTPTESRSLWEENEGEGRRIVTYHRVRVASVVAGSTQQEVWVRTLGGRVGEIGQRVEGTAVLRANKPVLLFLLQRRNGTHAVLEMAQGAYPVERTDTGEERIAPPVAAGLLLRRRTGTSARALLAGQRLSDAIAMIVAARSSDAK